MKTLKLLEPNRTKCLRIMNNLCLIFNRNEWEMWRLAKMGYDFTDEEIEKGLKDERGFLGQRNGVNCYISKFIKATPYD